MEIKENESLLEVINRFEPKFFAELEVLNFSGNTKNVYFKIIDEFREFLICENSDNLLKVSDLNKYLIMQFFQNLKNRKFSQTTISLYLKVIKRFFKFISENNESGIDLLYPIEKLSFKEEKKEIVTFSRNEYEKIKGYLLDYLDKTNNYERYKNALALAFIAYTGIRAEECLNIKEEDLDIEKDYIRIKIKGKGNKERFIYLDEVFIEYINKLKAVKPVKSIYLFSKKDGTKLGYRSLLNFNKRILKRLAILNKQKEGLHIYRHTLASVLVEDNINLETIKDILGHANISTTSRYYAKTSEKAKREALLKKEK